MRNEYYECGICEHNHPIGWDGDCRDANRFTDTQLDEKHGPGNWTAVRLEEVRWE